MSFKVTSNNTIYLTRGDTFKATISISNPDGTPYEPIEGDEVRFALKKDISDTLCLIRKDIPIDTLLLEIEPMDTQYLEFGNYVYDIQLTKANGDVDTFITASKFKITKEVE